jgi:hypothetical protein
MGAVIATSRSAADVDIAEYMLSLIPLEDHATVSALASTCRAYTSLFARFLHANGIVYLLNLAPDAEICLIDRMHGSISLMLTSAQQIILEHRLRAYVHGETPKSYLERHAKYTYQFRYGQLISWQRRDGQRVSEITSIMDVPVIIEIYIEPECDIGWLSVILLTSMNTKVVELEYDEDGEIWTDLVYDILEWSAEKLCDDDFKAIARILDADLDTLLAPYKARLIELLRSETSEF